MKKFLLLVLGVLLALPAYALSFMSEYNGQKLKFITTSDSTVAAYQYKYKTWGSGEATNTGDLEIPDKVSYEDSEYSVTSIGNEAFYECRGLTSVTIPNSVTSIGDKAFYECRGLTSVTIPNSVTSIGEEAFYLCFGLTSVTIGNSVTSIGSNAFDACRLLEKAEFGSIESLCKIHFLTPGSNPLRYAHNLWIDGKEVKELVIPETVTSIGSYAFSYCTGLTSVTIPNSVTSIGDNAFSDCTGLTSVTIPNSVTSIGSYAFSSCRGLTSVTIPNSVTSIGRSAFSACFGLTSVTIPNSVTSIGQGAFSQCSGLTSVTIPNSVTSIGGNAFYDCSGLTSVTIPNSVTSIGSSAFSYCSGLTSVTIPNSVISIGRSAFSYCSAMASVTIGNSVASIDRSAFYGCEKLSSVMVSCENLMSFHSDVFSETTYENALLSIDVDNLTEYIISDWWRFKNIVQRGAPLKTYSDDVLNYLLVEDKSNPVAYVISGDYSKAKNFDIPERFTDLTDADNPVRYNIIGVASGAFKDLRNLTAVKFNSRSTLKWIGSNAFKNCKNLSEIDFPATVESIGHGAFQNSGIKSVVVPDKVTVIEDSVFYNCTALADVKLSDNLVSIGNSAFYNCTALADVKLPANLVSIGNSAFAMSSSNSKSYGSLTVPASLKSVGENAFLYRIMDKVVINDLWDWCDIDFANNDSNPCGWAKDGLWLGDNEIVDLVIPDGVEEIKPYAFVINGTRDGWNRMPDGTQVLSSFGKLKSVKIPNSVKSIGTEAFCLNGCTEITIPSSVDSIGDRAFITGNITYTYTSGNYATVKVDPINLVLEDGTNPIFIAKNAFSNSINTDVTGGESYVTRYNTPDILYMGRPIDELPDGTKNTLKNLTVGNTVGEIAPNLFNGYKNLASAYLGAGVVTIGDNAFKDCSSLQEIVTPPSVETIGASAFDGCKAMTSIIMGHKMKTIGDKAFNGCPANTVSITAQTPPSAPNTAFSNYTGKLWLQGQGAVDAYYDAYTCWDRFNGYVMVEPTEMKTSGPKEFTGKPGDRIQLKATLMPEDVTLPQVFWRSTNPEIATVDSTGLVTLHADLQEIMTRAADDEDGAGRCQIIAESLYADGPSLSFDIISTAGVDDIVVDHSGNNGEIDYTDLYGVYNIQGVYMGQSLENLASGIYIVRQGTIVKKVMVK